MGSAAAKLAALIDTPIGASVPPAPPVAPSVQDAVARALVEARLQNERLIAVIRLSGITVFFALFAVMGHGLGERAWQGNLRYFVPYWSLAVVLFVAARRYPWAARLAAWSVALLDMPMVVLLQYATFPNTANAAAVAGYSLGIYVLLLLVEALSLDLRRVFVSAGMAALSAGLLQHLAGTPLRATACSLLALGIAAVACAYNCRRIVELIGRVGADVSERRRSEEALQARDDFLSMASHELKTPLTNLQLNVEGLRRLLRTAAPPPERVQARIEGMDGSTQRLTRLVERLLDVSRIRAGRLELEPEQVDLTRVASTVIEQRSEAATKAGCPIALHAPDPVFGNWDRMRMEQVLDNLVGNAVKYGGGHPIEVTVVGSGEDALVTVQDHGIGIDPGDHGRIFDRFERAVSRKHFSGLGVGLWICRQIVSAHKGQIAVESAIGQGSRFVVRLPRVNGLTRPISRTIDRLQV
jgi:signal transduction histidine kinase